MQKLPRPRLRQVRTSRLLADSIRWECMADESSYIVGIGYTPELAYHNWRTWYLVARLF